MVKIDGIKTILASVLTGYNIVTSLEAVPISPYVIIEELIQPPNSPYTIEKNYKLTINATSETNLESAMAILLKLDSRHPDGYGGTITLTATLTAYEQNKDVAFELVAGSLFDNSAANIESIWMGQLLNPLPTDISVTGTIAIEEVNTSADPASIDIEPIIVTTMDENEEEAVYTAFTALANAAAKDTIDISDWTADETTTATITNATAAILAISGWDRKSFCFFIPTVTGEAISKQYATNPILTLTVDTTGFPYNVEVIPNSFPYPSYNMNEQSFLLRARWLNI